MNFPVYLGLGDFKLHPHFVLALIAYISGFRLLFYRNLNHDVMPDPLKALRGIDLTAIRHQAIENLNQFNISTTLVVTLKKGLNNHEIGDIIEYALQQKSVRGVTFQPVQIAGRLENFEVKRDR